MRVSKPRTLARTSALGGLVLGVAFATSSACSGDAVGVEACQKIEEARCAAAPKCAGKNGVPKIKTEVEIANCKDLYRDHCLVGLENTTKEPTKDQIDGCVAAINATADCQTNMVATMADCMGVAVDATGAALEPCAAFEHPEHLTACAFIATATATTSADTTAAATTAAATTGAGAAGGSGG